MKLRPTLYGDYMRLLQINKRALDGGRVEDGWAKTVIVFLTGNFVNRLLAFLALIPIIIFVIFKIISVQLNKGILKKVSVQGNEIEIFEEDNDSYFDKYLNEVLYLFEKANTDVIFT